MDDNYVLVYEINAEQVLFVPESVFNTKFQVDLCDNSCYYFDPRLSEDELSTQWYMFSKQYKHLPKGKLNIKVTGNYDWEVEY